MSAYVVSTNHINYLVRAAIQYNLRYTQVQWDGEKVTHDNASEAGRDLLAECVKSVNHRYPNPNSGDLPGSTARPDCYKYPTMNMKPTDPVQVLKAIAGYEYQSCEHPRWAGSKAWKFCRELRMAAIQYLPGYEEADWTID